MASYSYSAINAHGLELRGELHAPDVEAARDQLRSRGLLLRKLTEVSGGSAGKGFGKRIKPKSLQIFSRQLATLIEAGVDVVAALTVLEQQTADQYLAAIVSDVRADVEGGVVLSKALSRHSHVFDRLYVSMVEAGEASGTLDVVLDRAAFQIEKDTKIKRRVKSAMVYPVVVMSFAFLCLTGLLLFVVPVFQGVFDQLNGQLPTLTQWVVNLSNLLKKAWFIIFPLLGGTLYGLLRARKTEWGRPIWDKLRLRIPMKIGDVVLKVSLARFSRTLSTLIASGVDVIKALEITGQTAGNYVIEQVLTTVRLRVQEGVPIAQPLAESAVIPPMVSQMVKIGEETGELDKMLGKVADFYEDEVDASISSLTSILEPVMMIGVGLIVGVIVIAMYLPMFKMLQLVK
jgi:type IV pilus assembly protein PilC